MLWTCTALHTLCFYSSNVMFSLREKLLNANKTQIQFACGAFVWLTCLCDWSNLSICVILFCEDIEGKFVSHLTQTQLLCLLTFVNVIQTSLLFHLMLHWGFNLLMFDVFFSLLMFVPVRSVQAISYIIWLEVSHKTVYYYYDYYLMNCWI